MAKDLKWQTSELGHPDEPGVYVILNYNVKSKRKTALYVGSSKNIHKRVMAPSHPYRILLDRADAMENVIHVKWKRTDDYVSLEKNLIQKLSPKYNIQHRKLTLAE